MMSVREGKRTAATYALVVDDGDLLHRAKATELFVKVTLLGADAKPKHAQDLGRIGRLYGA